MNADQRAQADGIAVAAEQIHAGLERLLGLATRTADLGPHLAVLQALWAPGRAGGRSVVQHLSDMLDTIAVSLDDVDDDQVAEAAGYLHEASDRLEDAVGGDRIERAQIRLTEAAVTAPHTTEETPVDSQQTELTAADCQRIYSLFDRAVTAEVRAQETNTLGHEPGLEDAIEMVGELYGLEVLRQVLTGRSPRHSQSAGTGDLGDDLVTGPGDLS